MALESLSNPLQALSAQPYVMNLRSQTALTNDTTWDAASQYFINDMVRSPTNGAMYVYEAWDPATQANTPSCIVSANDPASDLGRADGWAPTQGVGLQTVSQVSAVVTGVAAGAAGALGGTAGLSLVLGIPNGLGVPSTWLIKLDYSASLTGPADFAADQWVNWAFTHNGTAPVNKVASHLFPVAAGVSGPGLSVVLNVAADATTISVVGTQSATTAVLLLGNVVATYSRLA